MRILYVDDEETNLLIFEHLFKDRYEITTTHKPLDALQILEKVDFDAVITDMKMPIMNGIELVRKAKSTKENLKFFVLTAYDADPEIEQAINEQLIVKCLHKPINVDEVAASLRSALN
jgi:CheY-like chemotaxis protein